jgi:hypothetical protein
LLPLWGWWLWQRPLLQHNCNMMLTTFDDDCFETMLCCMLCEGPFESFQQVQDCEVIFPFWSSKLAPTSYIGDSSQFCDRCNGE